MNKTRDDEARWRPLTSSHRRIHMAEKTNEFEEMLKDEQSNGSDWSSDLMNHLLTAVSQSAVYIPEGFQLDGISLQRYSKGQFNVTFQYKTT